MLLAWLRRWQGDQLGAMCVVSKQGEEEGVCPLSNPINQRVKSAYKEVISLADQFQNVDATPILMLNIEMKSPCEKSCILTQ